MDMGFSVRYLVLMTSLTILVGCEPYQYDIKSSYKQVSKNITKTISSMEKRINTVGSKIVRKKKK